MLKFFIFRLITSLILLATCPKVSSAFVYSVNLPVGLGGVTGSITTDDTIGVLSTENIIDWNLLLNDGTGTFNLLGPLNNGYNSSVAVEGDLLTSTATNIFFNYSGESGIILFQNPSISSGINFWCAQGINSFCVNTRNGRDSIKLTLLTQGSPRSGVVSIAQVNAQPTQSTPESATLLGILTFGGTALLNFRKKIK